MMERVIILSLIAFLLCSCGTGRRVAPTVESADSVRTEVRTETVYRDSIVYVTLPEQSAERETRDSSSRLETDYAVSEARVDRDGVLHHSLRNKPLPVPQTIRVPTERRDSVVYRNRWYKVTVPVERELSPWQKWQMRGFWVLVSAVVVYVFRKPLRSLIRRFL